MVFLITVCTTGEAGKSPSRCWCFIPRKPEQIPGSYGSPIPHLRFTHFQPHHSLAVKRTNRDRTPKLESVRKVISQPSIGSPNRVYWPSVFQRTLARCNLWQAGMGTDLPLKPRLMQQPSCTHKPLFSLTFFSLGRSPPPSGILGSPGQPPRTLEPLFHIHSWPRHQRIRK